MPNDNHLYEPLITAALADSLRSFPPGHVQNEALDLADSHERLARHLGRELAQVIRSLSGKHAALSGRR